jgi:dCMP deaminase
LPYDEESNVKIPRLPWDKYWMLLAHFTATRSTCDRGPELLFDPGRHGVGAVLVKDKRCIAGGYNGSAPHQPHCDCYQCKICGAEASDPDKICHNFVAHGTGDEAPKVESFRGKYIVGGHIMRDNHCVRTIHSEMNAIIQCALDGTSPQGSTLYTTASPCFDCAKAIIRAGIVKVVFGQEYDSRYGLSKDVGEMLLTSHVLVEKLVITREELD